MIPASNIDHPVPADSALEGVSDAQLRTARANAEANYADALDALRAASPPRPVDATALSIAFRRVEETLTILQRLTTDEARRRGMKESV